MKTCGALLVLLCCCLAETQLRGETISENDITHQSHYGEVKSNENEVIGAAQRTEAVDTASTQQTCESDIHTVLREMTAEIAEQRVELRYTKTQLDAVETSLRATKKEVEELRGELRQTEDTLAASQRLVEQLKSENEALARNLSLTMSQVTNLQNEREESKVSFSASLVTSGAGHVGPFSAETHLKFKHVFINSGNGYNPNTGVFTAPVRGVYNFVVFLHGYSTNKVAVFLCKNGHHVVSPYSSVSSGNATPSNGASLLLEVGDVVYVTLWANSWVYDNGSHHTSFSGHLLFPM